MIKQIFVFVLFISVLSECGIKKEEKLPSDVDFTNTILFTAQIDDKYELRRPQIFAVEVDSPHTLYQLTDTRYPIEDPVWLPDGSGIVFLGSMYDNDLFGGTGFIDLSDYPDIFVLDTTGIRRIIKCWNSLSKNNKEKYKELYGHISDVMPTSSGKVVFNLGGYKFIVHDTIQSEISFSAVKKSPELAHIYSPFALSPDEKEVAFATKLKYASSTEIFIMSLENGDYKRLTNNEISESGVCWSRDGKIYFSSVDQSIRKDSNEYQMEIFVMDIDGKNKKNLTNTPQISESSPKVSPDDKLIAYIVEGEREHDKYYIKIWVMNNDGTNKRKIIGFHAYNYGNISWYPKK